MKAELPEVQAELTTRMRSGRLTRRAFLERAAALGVGSSAALTLLEACGGPIGGSSNPTVVFWNLFGGGDGARLVQMQDKFTQSHPDINLKAVTLSWGEPYYTKIAMSAAGGSAPDVGISHLSRLTTYVQMGFLEPIDLDLLAKHGVTQNDFLPEVWQRASYQGKLYAVPLDTHPYVMYYNTDICKKAGLLDDSGNLKPLQGVSQVMEAFKAAKQASGQWGMVFADNWRLFASLYGQLGGQILSPDAKEIVLDDGKAEQALSFMADLTQTSKVMPANTDYGAAVALFGSNKAGFHWNGEWEVTTFQAQNMHFSMTLFPNLFGSPKAWADSHSFITPRQSFTDPARKSAAYEFIASMLKYSQIWGEGGHIPAYLPVATSDAYKQLKPQSNYAAAAANVVLDPPAWFSGAGSQFESLANGAFGAVVLGQISPKQAISQFRVGLQKMVNTLSPV